MAVIAVLLLAIAASLAYWFRPGSDWAQRRDAAEIAKPPPTPGEPPVDAAALLRLPRELPQTAEGLNDESLAIGKLLVQRLPHRPEAHAQLAFAQLQLGQEREALQCWQEALARDGNFVDAHLGIGTIYDEQGDNERAIASYRTAIKLKPDADQAYRELVKVLLRAGRAKDALPIAEECTRRFPQVCEHHFWLGQVHLDLGNYEQARLSHLEAIRLDPEFPLSYFPLARACARLGKNDEAARYRQHFAAVRSANLQADRERTKAYDDHLTHTQRAVKRHVLAGSLELQFGDLRMAEAHWLRAAALDPLDAATRKALASLYQQQERRGAEIQLLDQLTRLETDNPQHALRKARLLVDLELWAAAEAALGSLVAADPESADGHLLLAEFYLKRGVQESAATHAEKAARLAPSTRAFLLLAAIREECGDRPGTLAALQQALSHDPGNAELRRAYEQLSR